MGRANAKPREGRGARRDCHVAVAYQNQWPSLDLMREGSDVADDAK
jgi:hypothetical protein